MIMFANGAISLQRTGSFRQEPNKAIRQRDISGEKIALHRIGFSGILPMCVVSDVEHNKQ
jgi:hypothetical protein